MVLLYNFHFSGKVISFNCKLCECRFNDPNAKEMHMKGRRHRLQYKKKVNPELVVEVKPSLRQRKLQEEKLRRQQVRGRIEVIRRLQSVMSDLFFQFFFVQQGHAIITFMHTSCVKRCGGDGRRNAYWRRKSDGIGRNEEGMRRSVNIWTGADDTLEAHLDPHP